MANNLDTLLDEYERRFDDCFPLMLCRGMAHDDICKIIRECLDKNKPYSPDLDPNRDY